MWPVGNMPGLAVWLAGIIAACPALALAPAARAQDDGAIEAPLLDRAHAHEAHRLVERWLEQGEAPERSDADIAVTGLSGVRVTLWHAGHAYGAGEAHVEDLAAVTDATGPAVDLVPLLLEAARQAFAGVHDTLAEAQLRAELDGSERDDADRPDLRDLAGELLVSVQLAGPLERIRLHDEARINELYAEYAPGAHGLRVTAADDDRRTAALWPATAIERNISPRGQLTHLLATTGHAPTAIGDLARRGGPRLARFEAVHVVRPHRNAPVVELVRGAVLLPQTQVDEATLSDVVTRLSRHLARRLTSEGLVRGTYLPTSNRYDPAVAEPADAALAVYALTRHLEHVVAVGDESAADARRSQLAPAIERLGEWLLAGADDAEPGEALAAASLTLLSLVDAPTRTGEQRAMRDELGQWLVQRMTGEAGFAEADADGDDADSADSLTLDGEGEGDDADDDDRPDVAAQALAVAALAGWQQQNRDDDLAATVTELLGEQAETQPNVASLWWRAAAYERMAEGLPEGAAAAVRSLGELGERFMDRQVRAAPELGPADVVGGFELQRVARGAPPNPDWRTAHVLAYQALALRTPGMVGEEQTIDWLLSSGLAARFLAQLVVDEPATYSMRSPADALGGVRLAPWDNRLTVSAQATTLLAILELQATLDRLAERGL